MERIFTAKEMKEIVNKSLKRFEGMDNIRRVQEQMMIDIDKS